MTKRILLVAPTAPFDTSFGAAQRTTLMYRALREFGEVEVVIAAQGAAFAAADGERPEEVARLTIREAPWYCKYQPDAETRKWAMQHLARRQYDLVVARELSTAGPFCEAIDAPLIADADDANYHYAPSQASTSARMLATAKTRARRFFTRRALLRFRHVWFATPRDQRAFPRVTSTILPNVAPEVSALDCHVGAVPTILFVGALWYGPNVEAVDRFIRYCWPAINRCVPSARLRIVGAGPVGRREAWSANHGVECPGFVVDLESEYRAAAFTIAPIRYGGGTQIKTLESLAFGRTAVVSSFVATGYVDAFKPGESLVVADAADETVARCIALLKDPETATRMALAGREVVMQRFGWQAFRAGVAKGLSQIDSQWQAAQ
ncbi:MAG: glycosyltransferase family 4 protein [Betaproteobacteria bacterium]